MGSSPPEVELSLASSTLLCCCCCFLDAADGLLFVSLLPVETVLVAVVVVPPPPPESAAFDDREDARVLRLRLTAPPIADTPSLPASESLALLGSGLKMLREFLAASFDAAGVAVEACCCRLDLVGADLVWEDPEGFRVARLWRSTCPLVVRP